MTSRATGTSNWYRMTVRDLEPGARRLWLAVREQVADTPAAKRDLERVRGLVAARHTRTQEFFATSAGQWDRLRTELFGAGLEWVALAGLLDPSSSIADLGAGTGQLAATLAPLVRQVIAVDESPAMIKAALQRLRGRPNAQVRHGSLEALPIEAGEVELAFMVLVLHHVVEPGRAIEEASRILEPGGRLVIVDMMPHERTDYRELMGHQWLGFDAETVGKWSTEAGFGPLQYRPLPAAPNVKGPLLFVATAVKG